MALIKLGGIIGGISGDLGGVNFVTSSKRTIVRQQRRPVADQSAGFLAQRSRITYLSHLWTTQTADTRAAWGTLASQQRWSDRLGLARQPTGREFFISHNSALLLCGLVPDTTTLPTPADTSTWTGISLSITGGEIASVAFLQPLFGPYAKAAVRIQTFFRPTPQLVAPLFQNVAGPLPQKWRFVKWQPGVSNAALDLYPEAGGILGPLAVGQRLAVLARWVEKSKFSSSFYTTIATR